MSQQPAQIEVAQQTEGAPVAGQGSQPSADRRDARPAKGMRGSESAGQAVPEQAGLTQPSGEGASGIKSAAPGQAARLAPLAGAAGQQGAADPGGNGQGEQKPGGEATQAQAAALGVQTPAAELHHTGEPKAAQHKGGLHESILAQVKDGVVTHDGKGNGQMSIRLNPGELGELKIQVRMEDNRLRVEVQADNRMVKDLLMSNLDSLKEALSSKNFTMAGFDVSTGGGGFNSPLYEERGDARQQSGFRFAKSGGYPAQEERRVNYLTGDANTLVDVRM